MYLTKEKLIKDQSEYLEGYPYRYTITANENRRYQKNGLNYYLIQGIEDKVTSLMIFLSRRIVARKELVNDPIRAVFNIEISKGHDMVHAHIIVGLKYPTVKTIEWINKFLFEKWNTIINSERSDDVNGKPVYINKRNKRKYNPDAKNPNVLAKVVIGRLEPFLLIYNSKDTSFYQRNQLAPYSLFKYLPA